MGSIYRTDVELLVPATMCTTHGFHETCHSVTFIVLVNSHLWCELTLALWCATGVTASFGVFLHEIKCNRMTSFMEFIMCLPVTQNASILKRTIFAVAKLVCADLIQ